MNADDFASTTKAGMVSASLLQRKYKISRQDALAIMNRHHKKKESIEKPKAERKYYFEIYWSKKNNV
jgi:hypothetical protein